jgi:hypothetical protein
LSATMVRTCKDCQVPRHSHAHFAYFSLVRACSLLSLWPDKCSCTDKGRIWVKGPKHVCKIFPPHRMWTLRSNIYALHCVPAIMRWRRLGKGHTFLCILDTCWIRMHHAFDVQVGLAAFLTCWCVLCVSGVAAPASTGSECRTHLR